MKKQFERFIERNSFVVMVLKRRNLSKLDMYKGYRKSVKEYNKDNWKYYTPIVGGLSVLTYFAVATVGMPFSLALLTTASAAASLSWAFDKAIATSKRETVHDKIFFDILRDQNWGKRTPVI